MEKHRVGKTIPLRRTEDRGARPVNLDEGEDYRGNKTPLPYGFRYAPDGSIEHIVTPNNSDAQNWGFLCSPIEFLATTEDETGKAPGLLVRIKNNSGKWNQIAFPRSALIGGDPLLGELIHHGLQFVPVGKAPNDLKRLLMGIVTDKRARCVPKVGWHEDTFVLPDEIFGQPQDLEMVFQPPYTTNHSYALGGTFDGWRKEVAARAVGNSRLIFAISAAFVGPLLKIARLDGGGFHYRGQSSTGKSTALHVAGSVWGGGEDCGYVRSWRTTDNALEGLALIHNDTLLPLDEIAEVDSRAAFKTAYMLSNGQGKARSNKSGDLRQNYTWRSSFLSTGEITLASKVSEDGRRVTAGQEVRVIDIPADAGAGKGLFETLHGFNRPAGLAEALRDATQRHYGHAARAFLKRLVADLPTIKDEVRETIGGIVHQICPIGADGQVQRVARRFVLVACAGEMAISFGVVPWEPLTVYNAALRMFEDWLRIRGGAGQKEEGDALDAVTDFLNKHSSRFRPWDHPDTPIIHDCAGYVRDTDEGRTFYIFKGTFQRDICAKTGIDPDHTADVLAAHGLLEKANDGKRACARNACRRWACSAFTRSQSRMEGTNELPSLGASFVPVIAAA
jgi:putative DNA primase/helicase